MNDLGYGQLSNPNWSHKLVLIHVDFIGNSSDILTTLAKDFIASYSLTQSPQIPRVDDHILITQSSLWTSDNLKLILKYSVSLLLFNLESIKTFIIPTWFSGK